MMRREEIQFFFAVLSLAKFTSQCTDDETNEFLLICWEKSKKKYIFVRRTFTKLRKQQHERPAATKNTTNYKDNLEYESENQQRSRRRATIESLVSVVVQFLYIHNSRRKSNIHHTGFRYCSFSTLRFHAALPAFSLPCLSHSSLFGRLYWTGVEGKSNK